MRTRPALLVFFVVAVVLVMAQGNRFILTNDEGILLDPAQKVAEGARPYVDFFGYMSPGSYWIQGALFKMLGASLWVGRIPVILDFSLQCALLFWLTARLASRRAALAAVVIFTGFQIADPSFLTAQHRWDSATLALAGICMAIRFPSTWGLLGSGALLASATWCTPSLALVGAAEVLWLCLATERRRFLVSFFGGVFAVTALAVGLLALKGSLMAFLQQMLWLQRNYAAVNVMPYGSVIGGYGRLFEDTAGLERMMRVLFVGCLALPAILPPAALLLWGVVHRRDKVPPESQSAVVLLALAAIALILAFTFIPLALLFSINNFAGVFAVRRIASPAGPLRVPADIAPGVANLLGQVQPGQTLFVHPYMPIYYFVTQARNPTRFAFLNAGMMTKADEAEALAALQSRPPQWLLYMRLTDAEFKRVFPNSGATRARFDGLETWLEKSYVPFDQPAVNIAGYRLYRRMALP